VNRWQDTGVADQVGRRAVVTGANTGLGYQTALALAGAGAEVVIAVRDLDRGQEAAQRIRDRVEQANLRVILLDLADLASVHDFAAAVRDDGPVDLLVNNAGLMLVPRRRLTADGFEAQMGVNHLGHFALTAQLLPALQQAPDARVVSVTSLMFRRAGRLDHRLGIEGPYSPSTAYAQSKLAVALFAVELERRLTAADSTVSSVLAHPGWSATGGRRSPRSGSTPGPTHAAQRSPLPPEKAGLSVRVARRATALLGSSAVTGARPQVYAATAPTVSGGELIGPRYLVRGAPRPVTLPATISDQSEADWLWSESVRLTGAEPLGRNAMGSNTVDEADTTRA
jgi:NAD(P)-dependent dehydrogenase (short-subunit alcohol dehydrogenase family)